MGPFHPISDFRAIDKRQKSGSMIECRKRDVSKQAFSEDYKNLLTNAPLDNAIRTPHKFYCIDFIANKPHT